MYEHPVEYKTKERFSTITHEDLLGMYRITLFPKSSTLAISHSVQIWEQYRGKGIGTKQHKHRLKMAKKNGIKVLICIVRSDNKPEKKILRKFNWIKLYSYPDNKTIMELWLKDLDSGIGERKK